MQGEKVQHRDSEKSSSKTLRRGAAGVKQEGGAARERGRSGSGGWCRRGLLVVQGSGGGADGGWCSGGAG